MMRNGTEFARFGDFRGYVIEGPSERNPSYLQGLTNLIYCRIKLPTAGTGYDPPSTLFKNYNIERDILSDERAIGSVATKMC